MQNKPFAESCEQNKLPILEVLKQEFSGKRNVLEIGSGTGQHAIFFAEQFPQLNWQTSERLENIPGINLWLDDANLSNVLPPFELDVLQDHWPKQQFDAIFSANTVHIMPWRAVEKLFDGLGRVMAPNACFCLYGPFNYHGEFTSDSNARFDIWLKEQDPERGIRDFEALNKLAEKAGLSLTQDYEMPANNRILVWVKVRD